MTDKPYTAADELLAVEAHRSAPCPVCGRAERCRCLVHGGDRHYRIRAVLDALAAAGRLVTTGRCGHRAPTLALIANPVQPTCALTAGHAGWHRGDNGSEWIELSRAATSCPCTCHQPDRCPCKPGTPTHRHGAGGYCTVGDPQHHVIAFAEDGTWSLEHPATCRAENDAADAAEWDCPVRQLAEKQITPDLAALVAGGRYACTVNDLGDVFQLEDRLHGDQCTQLRCAACGCWCHTEEPDPDAVQRMLDDATRAFVDADTSSERVEVIRDLLDGWYAAWPAGAVTDEHEGIAHQLVALVYAAEARASTPAAREQVLAELTAGKRPCLWCSAFPLFDSAEDLLAHARRHHFDTPHPAPVGDRRRTGCFPAEG